MNILFMTKTLSGKRETGLAKKIDVLQNLFSTINYFLFQKNFEVQI